MKSYCLPAFLMLQLTILLATLPATAQKTIIRFDADNCTTKGKKVSDIAVADLRPYPAHELGYMNADGLHIDLFTRENLETALAGLYRNHKDSTAANAPRLLIAVYHFSAYQYASGLSRNASLTYNADYFLSDASGAYHLAAHIDTMFALHATFISNSATNSIDELLCGIYLNLDTALSDPAYTFEEALVLDEGKRKQYPALITEQYKDEVYNSWEDFLWLRPSKQYSVFPKGNEWGVAMMDAKGRRRRAPITSCKVLVYHGIPYYIKSDGNYFELIRERYNFIHNTRKDLFLINTPKSHAFLFSKMQIPAGDTGNEQIIKNKYRIQYRYKINISSGRLVPLPNEYILLDTKVKD